MSDEASLTQPRVFLERNSYVPGMGTFGVMSVPDRDFKCVTVEQDWEGNEPSISCIPEGVYPLARDHFHRKNYEAFQVKSVPGRSRILIHRANTMDELAGCIAPGESYGVVHGHWAVKNTTKAFALFMQAMEGVQETTIHISSVFHIGRVGVIA